MKCIESKDKFTTIGIIMKSVNIIYILSIFLFGSSFPSLLWAEDDVELLRSALKEKMPTLQIDEISATPVPGILEFISEGQIYYLTPDARYMFEGELINLESRINLTEKRKGKVHMASINAMNEESMLVFKPKGKNTEREITVFTDTSCPYCSKFHSEIDQIINAGIKVRYLLYPRAGVGSSAYENLQSVWCADDQQAAMTAAKRGDKIEKKTCENAIAQHIELARKVGLRGTPLIYLDSGEIINGYRPANQIVPLIEKSEPLK